MSRLQLQIVIGSLFMGVALFLIYTFFWFGSLRIEGTDNFDYIVVNGERYTPTLLSQGPVTVRPGAVEITAIGSDLVTQTLSEDVGFLEEKAVLLESVRKNAEQIARTALPQLPEGYRILDISLFEDNTWLALDITSTDGRREGSTLVYKFNDEWTLIEAGTGLDESDYAELGIPSSVVNYLARSGL